MYQLNLDSPTDEKPAAMDAMTQTTAAPKFYVVGLRKFYALFFGTLGMYIVYWFYRHWQAIKAFNQSDIWPIPRAIFLVFFTHDLFGEINRTLISKAKDFSWPISPMFLATLMVVVTLISNGADKISEKIEGFTALSFLSLILLPVLAWGYGKAQQAANLAADDPSGQANNTLTTANYIWIVLCGFLWIGILYAIFVYLSVVV